MASGAGPVHSGPPGRIWTGAQPVWRLSLKRRRRLAVGMTFPAEDTAPARAPDSRHLAAVVSGG